MSVLSMSVAAIMELQAHCAGPTLEEHRFAYGDAVEYVAFSADDFEQCVSMKGAAIPSGPCLVTYAHYPSPNVHYFDACEAGRPEKLAGPSDLMESFNDIAAPFVGPDEIELGGGGPHGSPVQGAGIGAPTPNGQADTIGGFVPFTPFLSPLFSSPTNIDPIDKPTEVAQVTPVTLPPSGWFLALVAAFGLGLATARK